MTVKGATEDELARAVRHSMVVIDAPKHKLDWRQSEKDNRIKELKKKYMYDPDTGSQGASTIFSRAKSDQYVDERRAARANEGGPIDPKTGNLIGSIQEAVIITPCVNGLSAELSPLRCMRLTMPMIFLVAAL